jgi:ATP/maltotriose-dependent transcriptional regulator MalT
VKTHLIRVFTKLDVDDRTAAVTAAMRLGLLPQP